MCHQLFEIGRHCPLPFRDEEIVGEIGILSQGRSTPLQLVSEPSRFEPGVWAQSSVFSCLPVPFKIFFLLLSKLLKIIERSNNIVIVYFREKRYKLQHQLFPLMYMKSSFDNIQKMYSSAKCAFILDCRIFVVERDNIWVYGKIRIPW